MTLGKPLRDSPSPPGILFNCYQLTNPLGSVHAKKKLILTLTWADVFNRIFHCNYDIYIILFEIVSIDLLTNDDEDDNFFFFQEKKKERRREKRNGKVLLLGREKS